MERSQKRLHFIQLVVVLILVIGTLFDVAGQSEVDQFIYESAPFPECHASTLAITPSGVVAAWFGGTEEKNKDVEIWFSKRSSAAWSVPKSVAHGIQSDGTRYPCWNPVLHQVDQGPLLLFFKVGPNPREWWGEMKSSDDGGETWSEAWRLPHGGIGPVKNKPVTLANGDLLCPSSTEHDGWRVHFELSADGGRNWDVFPAINDASKFNIIQPSVLFHQGRLQLIARSKEGVLVTAWSEDDGKSWTSPEAMQLPNPNSGSDAVTLKDGRHVLIYNHTTTTPGRWGGPRSPLNLAISEDGTSWQALAILENEPGEYSYPAVVQDDQGRLHITYTWKRKKVKYRVLTIDDLQSQAIVDSKWPQEIGTID